MIISFLREVNAVCLSGAFGVDDCDDDDVQQSFMFSYADQFVLS